MKACAIIGASSGVGAALAGLACAEFEPVYCVSRRGLIPPEADPDRAVGITADVRDFAEMSRVFADINARTPLQALVNCAAVGFFSPLQIPRPAAWREIADTNLLGLMNMLVLLRNVLESCECFVHVGSLAAVRPTATQGNLLYAATKVAGKSMLDDFRRELRRTKRKLRVTHLCPGFIGDTDFGANFFKYCPEEKRDLFCEFEPLQPQQVAAVIRDVLLHYAEVELSEIVLRPLGQPD